MRTVTHAAGARHSPGQKGLDKRGDREGEQWRLLPYLLSRRWVPNILSNLKERDLGQMQIKYHSGQLLLHICLGMYTHQHHQ